MGFSPIVAPPEEDQMPVTGPPRPGRREARDVWRQAEAEDRAFRDAVRPENRPAIAARLGGGSRAVYLAVRDAAEPLLEDRPLEGDIRAVRRRLEDGSLVAAVSAAVEGGLRPVPALPEPPQPAGP
jgi:hypothetical protein